MPITTQTPPPVRMAIAGMSHGHVHWILRTLQRYNLQIVGFGEPNRALAERYAAEYNFSLDLVYADLAAMLDATKPEAALPLVRSMNICKSSMPVRRAGSMSWWRSRWR